MAFKPDIRREIERFVYAIGSLDLALALSMSALQKVNEDHEERLRQLVSKHTQPFEKQKRKTYRFVIKNLPQKSDEIQNILDGFIGMFHELVEIDREIDRAKAGLQVVPRSFLVALVSQYDAYLGNLIKSLFCLRPEMLESSERSVTFSELCRFGSIDGAREYILEKELEALLRKSHPEQFAWLEKKFNLALRTDLTVWPTFVEVTERRNLCVHTDAVVSSQYLEVCKQNGVNVGDRVVGEQLNVTQEYFAMAYDAIYEVGVKLGQVLWRKVVPDQMRTADGVLQDITFALLKGKRYPLARILLEFANVTLRGRHFNEHNKLIFLINFALAFYLAGDKDECKKIISKQDWSATSDEFKLAHCVLLEEFDEAASLVRKIGRTGRPRKADYLYWPLFENFRKAEQFALAFKDVFGDVSADGDVAASALENEEQKESGAPFLTVTLEGS